MLKKITTKSSPFSDYRGIIEDDTYDAIKRLAAKLKGARIMHLNATAVAGGVAEILRSEAPFMRSLGLDAEWYVFKPPEGFFDITKLIHSGLQGESDLTPAQWQTYEKINRQLGAEINTADWDYIFVHDPQPAALINYVQNREAATWIWRCHLDSSEPNPAVAKHVASYLQPYDGAIFTMPEYVLPGLSKVKTTITPVTIDPLSPKNQPMSMKQAHAAVARFGVDPERPLVTQVSRFDQWKNPLGVVEAWQIARKEIPDLQLALVGNMPKDDPRSNVILRSVQLVAKSNPDIYVLADKADDRAVKAFQVASNAVIQFSRREGFGLTVTEALWAGTPVIGTPVGGIVKQILSRQTGYLVNSTEELADRMMALVRDPALAKKLGQAGHDHVKQNFLLPHLVHDDLRFLLELRAGP